MKTFELNNLIYEIVYKSSQFIYVCKTLENMVNNHLKGCVEFDSTNRESIANLKHKIC